MENGLEKRSETEGVGTTTGVSDRVNESSVPAGVLIPAETEVTWRHGKRKKYTESYKRQIVEHVAELRRTGQGDIGGYLRREGIYYTMVSKWEKKLKGKGNQQQDSGRSARGKQMEEKMRLLEKELEESKKELARTKKKLEKSEMIIDFQKKNFNFAEPGPGTGEEGLEKRLLSIEMIHRKNQEIDCSLTVYEMCDALRLSRATYYRWISQKNRDKAKRPSPPRKLSEEEEEKILHVMNSDKFRDLAPNEIFHRLLDNGIYYCSSRTMYRILERNGQNVQRRQKEKGEYERPELLATRPNELWSWDITKLKGPKKWTYFYLYKIMDVYSRTVVGWLVAHRESKVLARTLIDETSRRQNITEGQLTLHADRGSSMKSNVVGQLLMDLGVVKTHSRPHVSNDNPYSESLFKTLKYRPDFPEKFNSIEDARLFCMDFFRWYNKEHRHSGIAYLTPEDVHYGRVDSVITKRQAVMDKVFQLYPERFVKGSPVIKKPAEAVWINKPEEPAVLAELDRKIVA